MEAHSMTLSELWPRFQGHDIFEVEYRRVLKTKLLLHNRKLYLTYGIVLCLVTLTDLQTRRAGLSASVAGSESLKLRWAPLHQRWTVSGSAARRQTFFTYTSMKLCARAAVT